MVLSNLNENEIDQYVRQVRKRLIRPKNPGSQENKSSKVLDMLFSHFKRFLLAFSGGHGRTTENITEIFVQNANFILDKWASCSHYEKFTDYIFNEYQRFFRQSPVSRAVRDELKRMQSLEEFGLSKKKGRKEKSQKNIKKATHL